MGTALHSGRSLQTAYALGLIKILYHRKDITLTKLQEEIGGNWHRMRLCLRLAVDGLPMPWEREWNWGRETRLIDGSVMNYTTNEMVGVGTRARQEYLAAMHGLDWKKD